MNCYICNIEITADNESDEHIIINAIGGRLKSKELICNDCNSEFGEKIDSILAKQLNNLSNVLMVKRHRGEPRPIIGENQTTGEKYILDVGGQPRLFKPTIEKNVTDNNTGFSITARSEKELKDILKGIAKKNQHLNVDEAMKSAQWKTEDFDKPLHFQNVIGGADVFRAVCKSATNFFIYKKGNSKYIKHLIPYLKGKEEKDIVWMHYQDDLYEFDKDECFHIIHLIGNPDEKILYCYIEYFSTQKYLILLSDNYDGKAINETYFFDLSKVKPIERELRLNYDRATLLDFFDNKDVKPFEKIKKSFDHSIKLGLKRQDDYKRGEILERAIQNSLGKYPDGVQITEEIIKETVDWIFW